MADSDPRVDEYVATTPKRMRSIVAAARAALRETMPKATETVKWSYPTYVGKGNVVAIAPQSDHVNLQFYLGTSLADPTGRLEGTGKNLRHVKIHHAKDLKEPAVKAIVRSAWRVDQA